MYVLCLPLLAHSSQCGSGMTACSLLYLWTTVTDDTASKYLALLHQSLVSHNIIHNFK